MSSSKGPRIICTVTNDLSHDQRMIRICTSLAKAGYEVWLVGRKKANSPLLPDRSFRQIRLTCFFSKGKLFYLEYNLRLLYFLYRHQARIINSIDLDTLLPGYLISRIRTSTECIYDAHEYFTETPEVIRRRAVQLIWEKLADWIIPNLRYCYTVGPALAQLFEKRYGPKFAVVRNLPLRTALGAKSPAEKKVILYQGMLNEGRGLEVAIEAMLLLPQAELWLAGNGDIMDSLAAQVKRLELTDRVQFLGFVPPDDLPALTQQAWLGLNLLENRGLSYYYSLANKALDYLQAGLPSVQMDFPEYRALQYTYHPFLLLNELDATQLARMILELAALPEQYSMLQANCLRAATALCWENEEPALLAVYQEALQEDQ